MIGTTSLIISIMLAGCIQQMSPSPILMYIGAEYGIAGNDALMNLAISIIFPTLIAGCLMGGVIEKKIGTKSLLTLTGIFSSIGLLINFVAFDYVIFLIGRAIYGLGFGLGIPFMGSSLMKWYSGKGREAMTTVNSLFPFVGTVTSYLFMARLFHLFSDNVRITFGVWGILMIILTILWIVFVKDRKEEEAPEEAKIDFSIYLDLLKVRTLRLLSITFVCDFACYSYMATVLPTYLMEVGHMDEAAASLWSAIAFPAAGILGCFTAGIVNTAMGSKRFPLITGQILKLAGISTMTLLGYMGPASLIVGTVLFGLGNSFWMPSFYGIPTELPGMNGSLVAASFSLCNSCGFLMGFIVPVAGGIITGFFADHATGLTTSLIVFNLLNVFALIEALRVPKDYKTAPATMRTAE